MLKILALLLSPALSLGTAWGSVPPLAVSGSVTVQGTGADGTSTAGNKPILISGQEHMGLGVANVRTAEAISWANDSLGNPMYAIATYDTSHGGSVGGAAFLTPGAAAPTLTGVDGQHTMLLDVSGTWTGSFQVRNCLTNCVMAKVRQYGTGTMLSTITTNGIYVVEAGELSGIWDLVNSVSSGSAEVDFSAYVKFDSGFYSHQAGDWSIKDITGAISLPTGAATAANQSTEISSLSSINTKLPALGQSTMSASTPVVIASNQSAVPVSGPLTDTQLRASAVPVSISGIATDATPTITSVAASVTSVTLKASNANRMSLLLYNDSTSAAYVAFAATATTSAFTNKMAAGSFWRLDLPMYTGAVSALWDTAVGNMRVTEVTK